MKHIKLAIFALTLVFLGTSCSGGYDGNVSLKTTEDSVAYYIGGLQGAEMMMGMKQVSEQQDVELNEKVILAGIIKAFEGDSTFLERRQEISNFLNDYFSNLEKKRADKIREAGSAFLAENAKKDGVQQTESGLQYQIIKEGDGAKPKATDRVKVHYHGTLTDGTVFDSSVERGEPVEFPVTGVIPGWVEALQMMPVGSKWKLFIPSDLAYGDRATGSIPAGSTLIFEVDLLEIPSSDK